MLIANKRHGFFRRIWTNSVSTAVAAIRESEMPRSDRVRGRGPVRQCLICHGCVKIESGTDQNTPKVTTEAKVSHWWDRCMCDLFFIASFQIVSKYCKCSILHCKPFRYTHCFQLQHYEKGEKKNLDKQHYWFQFCFVIVELLYSSACTSFKLLPFQWRMCGWLRSNHT